MRPLAFDPIIADAYRQAALEGRDMYAFAGQMERLKAAAASETDLYKQWDRLEDLIGDALWANQEAAHLLLLREHVVRSLQTALPEALLLPGATPEEDWSRWRQAFSEASFQWHLPALRALGTASAFQNRFGEKLERYRRFTGYFLDRRWVEAREVFEDLATDPAFSDEHRGYHHYVCGQVDLYFHYDYERAKSLFAAAEKLLSGKPLSRHGWIEYYLKSPEKDLDRAAALAEEALRLDASHSPTFTLKGDVQAEKGQLADAEASYRQARALRPGNSTPYTRLIELYGKKEWFEQKSADIATIRAINDVLDPETRHLTWGDLASIYQQQGETFWPQTEQLLHDAAAIYPEGIMPLLNLGYFYLDTNRAEAAKTYFQQVIDKTPEAREGYLAMARWYEAREQWPDAATCYERVLEIIPSWERFMRASIGRCLRNAGQWAAAEKELLQAWAQDPYDDSGAMTELYALEEKYYQDTEHPQPDHAVEMLAEAGRRREGTPELSAGRSNRQGHALFYVGRYEEALPYYQRAAELKPEEPVYLTNQADCWDKLYRQNGAETHYRQALDALARAAALAPQDSSIPKKRRKLALVRHNPHLAELPILYQVYVEVGVPLIGQVTLDYQTLLPEITNYTEEFRRRMNARFGIKLPGLRYRDTAEAEPVFQFRWYETPVFRDQLHGPEPQMTDVLGRLEEFITQYGLDLFINYWDVDQEVPLLPNAELVHFTRVIMALLADQTPLPPLPELHQRYRQLDGPRLPLVDAVEQLRMTDGIREHLYGVGEEYFYCPLGAAEEQILQSCLLGQGGHRALALPLELARELLGAVLRLAQTAAERKVALVTAREVLRPLLRSVLAGLPAIPVLKSAELPAGASARMLEPLSIRPDDAQFLLDALQQPGHAPVPDTSNPTQP